MATTHLIPVGEYLGSTYRPDVDYVDGHLEERALGETDHGTVQTRVILLLASKEQDWAIRVLTETRVQTSSTRFRIPDVCVMPRVWVRTPIVTEPPLLCIEVLSPGDTVSAMRRRVQDFLEMSVKVVWILDPQTRTVYVCVGAEMTEQRDGPLWVAGTAIQVAVGDIFATLDNESSEIPPTKPENHSP